jgi:hypothetical protein
VRAIRSIWVVFAFLLIAPAVALEPVPIACPLLTKEQFEAVAVDLPEHGGYGPVIIRQQHTPYQACRIDSATQDVHCETEDPGIMKVSINGAVTYLLIPDSAVAQIDTHEGKLRTCTMHAGKPG